MGRAAAVASSSRLILGANSTRPFRAPIITSGRISAAVSRCGRRRGGAGGRCRKRLLPRLLFTSANDTS